MAATEPPRRSVMWHTGVFEFTMPTAILVWAVVVVDQAGWSGLWSARGLLSLLAIVVVSLPIGMLTGAAFYWIFHKKE